MDIIIRKMLPADVEGVYAIELDCFSSEAWARADFESLADNDDDVFAALIAEQGGEICGYICGSCVGGETEIGSIAVAKSFRRMGIARRLIAELERQTDPQKAYLEVRVSNASARALYKAIGFEEIAIRRRYYDNPPEDAIVMEKIYNTEKK